MRTLRKTATTLLAAGALVAATLTGTQAASASVDQPVASEAQEASITPAEFQAALQGLEASGVPRTVVETDEATFYEYNFDEGSITLPSEETFLATADGEVAQPDPGTVSTMIEFITKGQYMAVGFNKAEQAALTAGGGVAIGLALCAIPGACVISTILVAGATGYLAEQGLCPGNQLLWWHDVNGGSTFSCSTTAPALP